MTIESHKLRSSVNSGEAALFDRAERTIDAARSYVDRSSNIAMVHAYWLIGRDIVDVEQAGRARAGYGDELIERLAQRLARRFGRGFSPRTVRRIRQFYVAYREGSQVPVAPDVAEIRTTLLARSDIDEIRTTLLAKSRDRIVTLFPPTLGWSHYATLIKIEDASVRAFYEIEAARQSWTVRELNRQIATMLYHRLAKSRDKDGVLALAREGQQVTTPASVLKDPLVLEFLDLPERPQWRERDLEQAIIDRLEAFLLELGRGFCFVARQKRITLDGDHFYVDLVFYNRLLRCFVLVDLKLDKLTHQDLGQMQMYVNLYDATERTEGEAATVGIVLCSEKNDAMVRITLPKESQVHASRYQLYLPTEEELSLELALEREAAERQLLAEALEFEEDR